LSPKKGAIFTLKKVATDFILSPFWRQIAPSGHPGPQRSLLDQGCRGLSLVQNTFVQKASYKMLVKLTPGVDFINILRVAFTLADPKSSKRH